ncbi:MAG TPA: sulfatase/phosphatase domain-containing protein, partial [Tichowtungia sp.]|nr:sulfatase/phosphatase domain-containing protein [Tichowtungia sp.]
LMMRWPGRIPAGQRCDALVQNIDYAPTFCELAGIMPPKPMHGVSLLPLMKGKRPAAWRKSLYYFYYEFPLWHRVQPHYGVSDERYKLIHFYMADDWQLIDLQKDPYELKNFISDPVYQEERDRLYAELLRLRKHYMVPEKLPNPTNKRNKDCPAGELPGLSSVFPK